MATITAGDVRMISVDHDELGPLQFEHKSGEDALVKLGGFMSNDDDTNITVSGIRIDQKNRKPWEVELTVGSKDGDVDYMQKLTEALQEGTWTFLFMNGQTRSGSGTIVGDIQQNYQAGTIAMKIQGSGRLNLI